MTLLPVLYKPTIEREEEKYDDHTQSSQSFFILEGQGICNIFTRIYDLISDLFLPFQGCIKAEFLISMKT